LLENWLPAPSTTVDFSLGCDLHQGPVTQATAATADSEGKCRKVTHLIVTCWLTSGKLPGQRATCRAVDRTLRGIARAGLVAPPSLNPRYNILCRPAVRADGQRLGLEVSRRHAIVPTPLQWFACRARLNQPGSTRDGPGRQPDQLQPTRQESSMFRTVQVRCRRPCSSPARCSARPSSRCCGWRRVAAPCTSYRRR